MLIPVCKITFIKQNGDSYTLDFVTQIEIEESFLCLTNTFKITFPRALDFQGQNLFHGSTPVFQRGDQVKVELGYFPKLRPIFIGWVANISAKIPIEITCEDDMFLLKNQVVSYPDAANINVVHISKKNGTPSKRTKVISPQITLKQLLDHILPADVEYEAIDFNLGMFRATKVSAAKVLEVLKDKYGLYATFDLDRKLIVGFQSNAASTNVVEFQFEYNIIDDSNLEYQRSEDVSMKVVVISIDLSDVKTEIEVGDPDGAQRTYHMFNAKEADMREFANKMLNEVKYTGYVGTFTTFGEPYVRPGDVAKLTSTKLPERNGNYIISSVKRTFGISGYRQEIELNSIE